MTSLTNPAAVLLESRIRETFGHFNGGQRPREATDNGASVVRAQQDHLEATVLEAARAGGRSQRLLFDKSSEARVSHFSPRSITLVPPSYTPSTGFAIVGAGRPSRPSFS